MGNPWIEHIKKVKESNIKLFKTDGLKAIILLAKESYKSGSTPTKEEKSKVKKSLKKSKKGKKGKKGKKRTRKH